MFISNTLTEKKILRKLKNSHKFTSDKEVIIYQMFQQGYKPNQIFKHFEDLKRDPTVPGKHKGVSKSKIYEILRLFKEERLPVPKNIYMM